jgi:uncharacterized membrane protein YbhN (UPF0104 family)
MHARANLAIGAGVAALAVVAFTVFGFGSRLGTVFAGLASARPAPLWFAGVAFVAALVCSAGAWRSAFGRCGACIDAVQAASWYGLGSLANSLAPARVGDVVRGTLFARSLEGSGRVWTAAGALAAVGAARTVVLLVLVAAGTAAGLLPLWPVVVLAGLVVVAAVVCVVAKKTRPLARVSHLVQAVRAFPRSPAAAAALVLWAGGATAAKLFATTAVAYSLGVHSPFAIALIIVPTLELAAIAPLTPGNIGVASGAIAVALRSRGVALDNALALGIAVHAVEMLAGLSFGLLSALVLTGPQIARDHRWKVAAAAVAVCAAASGALAATTFVDLS